MASKIIPTAMPEKLVKRPRNHPRGFRGTSLRRAKELKEYRRLKRQERALHPVCELYLNGDCPRQKIHPPEDYPHHIVGREGRFLNMTEEWLWCCWSAHDKIEKNRKWAKEKGYLKLRI